MGVVIFDGSAVRNFVNDEEVLNKAVGETFESLDLNDDGVLSCSELRKAFESFRLIETHFGVDNVTPPEELPKLYDFIFEKFDLDRSGTIDRDEFNSEMKNILLAIARAIITSSNKPPTRKLPRSPAEPGIKSENVKSIS